MRSWRVKLSRTQFGGASLRTPTVEGVTFALPTVGRPFVVVANPLQLGDVRVVNTSRLVRVPPEGEYPNGVIVTESGSAYELQVVEEPS